MKTLLTRFLLINSMILALFTSCKKDGVNVVAQSGTPPTLLASATNLTLTKALATNAAVNFTWSNSNYGYSAAATYTLQFDLKGHSFSSPKEIISTANLNELDYTVLSFNTVALSMGLPVGVSSSIEVRVKSTISTSIAPIYSNVVSMTVIPYSIVSYVYAPGSYQNTSAGLQWNPATADSLVSTTSNGVYTGYIYFNSGAQFKITPIKSWATAYGDAGGGKISTSGGNLVPPGVGLYLVTVDLNANAISYTSADHTWSVIGDAAQGWSTDVAMTFNINANAYQVTTPLLATGGFKFRADNAWALSYGDVTPVTGQVTSSNGANISAPAIAGNYLISLSYGNPLLGPTYKLVKQ